MNSENHLSFLKSCLGFYQSMFYMNLKIHMNAIAIYHQGTVHEHNYVGMITPPYLQLNNYPTTLRYCA